MSIGKPFPSLGDLETASREVFEDLNQGAPLTPPKGVASAVDHPPHYNVGSIEVAAAIESWRLGWHCGDAVKYIARAGHKDPTKEVEDLEKAIWYLKRRISILRPRDGR